ncbi:serine hydrolase domain-containing protein [Rheinheimera soli]|uniref:CubicO group peptidase (Beta-lactamase class C family) n=1 Tax=Rheinheimera soli TaxID=443616 RepID=A0ABU1VWR4_9GAMM|nr:serine hydrolase domain-containing protein [Rheinheimera soli]MDR7120161.1 CubicO group peptidase (beta-lactamase class C family) [Rheinheimera soli]
MPGPQLLHKTLMLVAACSVYTAAAFAASSDSTALNEKISRVEQGLSTSVVVKGASAQKMRLADRMHYHQVPAVSIAVVNNGQIEWARAYGVNVTGNTEHTTPSTLFQTASISKAVSAMAALHLVEQGKLQLDGDVNNQLKSWKLPDNEFTKERKVSLRQLLNHSGGVNVHGFHGYEMTQTVPSLLAVLKGETPANTEPVRVEAIPGTKWSYSGGGYSIIQLMMMEASQQDFPQLLQDIVFTPLNMQHSRFAPSLPKQERNNAAAGHNGSGATISGLWHQNPELAAAGLWSTSSDLAKIIIEVQKSEAGTSDKILSSPMTKTMLTRGLGETGLGFFVEQQPDRTSFSHSGGNDGFRTLLFGYTKTGQGAVVLTNSDNGTALIQEIFASIATEYNWPDFKVIEKSTIAPDATLNQKLAGEYLLLDKPASIIAEGNSLYLQSNLLSSNRLELHREANSSFFLTVSDATVRFETDAKNQLIGFSLIKGVNTYPATKVR